MFSVFEPLSFLASVNNTFQGTYKKSSGKFEFSFGSLELYCKSGKLKWNTKKLKAVETSYVKSKPRSVVQCYSSPAKIFASLLNPMHMWSYLKRIDHNDYCIEVDRKYEIRYTRSSTSLHPTLLKGEKGQTKTSIPRITANH